MMTMLMIMMNITVDGWIDVLPF